MRRRRSTGQALLEFSLVLPIFLVMLMGVVDVGRAIWAQNSLAAAAREGARFAIVHGGSMTTACPVGPPVADVTIIPPASAPCPYPSPSTQAIKDAVIAAANAGGTSLTVTVCYGTGCSGDTNALNATNARGTPVTVAVSSRINLITPSLLGMGGFGVSSVTTMVVNH
ncbi:MAG TPA: TadE/TadG family type IV pilus assembly protein [Candidatus Limnocylindrales bacterium]|nr:TadE/TadG family type IV pilus assembly protein [Candidatus Limnocylindrales bacterium]